MAFIDGKLVDIARDRWRSLRMEDQADAVFYPARPPQLRRRDCLPGFALTRRTWKCDCDASA